MSTRMIGVKPQQVTRTYLNGRWLVQNGAELQQERLWTGGSHSWRALPVQAQGTNSINYLTNRLKPQVVSQQARLSLMALAC